MYNLFNFRTSKNEVNKQKIIETSQLNYEMNMELFFTSRQRYYAAMRVLGK